MQVPCSQCGASIEVPADANLLECPYCSTALVVVAGGTIFREVMEPTVNGAEAVEHLRRFMAGTKTVADLDTKVRIGEPEFFYFPFWAFRIQKDGSEQVLLEPASPSAIQGLHGMTLPPGKMREWSEELKKRANVLEPEVPLATARKWLEGNLGTFEETRVVLYHLPAYRFSYTYRDRTYTAVVDGVSGRVFPADFPAKAETPFVAVMVLALVVFAVEGLAVGNLFLKALVYVVSAVPIFGLAWWISRKV